MIKRFTQLAATTILLCVFANQTFAKKINVLFLGNSYTYRNNLPDLIKQLALSFGDTLIYSISAPGGHTFQGHVSNPTSLSLIAAGGWDFVILQEQSQRPSFPDPQVAMDVYPYARKLDSLVHIYSPCAKTMFYVTWGRKNGDQANCQFFTPLCTYEGMDSLLQLRYTVMADDNHASIAPVAMVWRKIRTDYPGIELYDADESHPSPKGSFAAACTFYATLFEKDPTQCTYNFSLSANEAQTIKTIAKELVYDSLHFWHRFVKQAKADFSYHVSGQTITFQNNSIHANSYLWDFGDGHTDTAKNPVHTYAQPGSYDVKLIVYNEDCESSESSVSITIEDFSTNHILDPESSNELSVFPNPVQNKLLIRMNQSGAYNLVITTMEGKVIQSITLQGYAHELNIDELPAGIYQVSISSVHQPQKTWARKFVKQ